MKQGYIPTSFRPNLSEKKRRKLWKQRRLSMGAKHPVIGRLHTITRGMSLSYKQVSNLSRVSYGTIYSWFSGKTRDPRFSTVEKVLSALNAYDFTVMAPPVPPKLRVIKGGKYQARVTQTHQRLLAR
jgi:hypothetical protein